MEVGRSDQKYKKGVHLHMGEKTLILLRQNWRKKERYRKILEVLFGGVDGIHLTQQGCRLDPLPAGGKTGGFRNWRRCGNVQVITV